MTIFINIELEILLPPLFKGFFYCRESINDKNVKVYDKTDI